MHYINPQCPDRQLHVLYPGTTPKSALDHLLATDPMIVAMNLRTCMVQYSFALDSRNIPAGLQFHPEVQFWRKYYVALAVYGHMHARCIHKARIDDSRTPRSLGRKLSVYRTGLRDKEINYFARMLKKLHESIPLDARPGNERKPQWLRNPDRARLDRHLATGYALYDSDPGVESDSVEGAATLATMFPITGKMPDHTYAHLWSLKDG